MLKDKFLKNEAARPWTKGEKGSSMVCNLLNGRGERLMIALSQHSNTQTDGIGLCESIDIKSLVSARRVRSMRSIALGSASDESKISLPCALRDMINVPHNTDTRTLASQSSV